MSDQVDLYIQAKEPPIFLWFISSTLSPGEFYEERSEIFWLCKGRFLILYIDVITDVYCPGLVVALEKIRGVIMQYYKMEMVCFPIYVYAP